MQTWYSQLGYSQGRTNPLIRMFSGLLFQIQQWVCYSSLLGGTNFWALSYVKRVWASRTVRCNRILTSRHGVPQGSILDIYFFFYILTIFLKLYQTNLILFCSLMTLVLSLQILIPWHLGIILMKSLGK